MSNEEHPQGRSPAPPGHSYEHGGWQPTPHGEYDPEGTAFVQLPTEDVPHAAPLEAPGHGYVPPMITPLTPNGPPSAPAWPTAQQAQEHTGEYVWHDPSHQPQGGPTADAHATGQWAFPQAEHRPAEPRPVGSDATGQWSIPLAGNNLPEETGEFTRAMLQSQWSSAPATLPGGATAPWATDPSATLPGGAPAPWAGELQQHEQPGEPLAQQAPQPEASAAGSSRPQSVEEPPASASAEAPVEHTAVADGAPDTEPQRPEAAEPSGLPEASAEEHPSDPGPAEDPPAPASAESHGHSGQPEAEEAEEAREPAAERPPGPQEQPDPSAAGQRPTGPVEPSAETAPTVEGGAEPVDAGADPQPVAFDASTDTVDPQAEGFDAEPDADDPSAALLVPPPDEHPPTSYVLRVNGSDRPVTDAWIGESLLYVLRERLGLAGAKDGCSQGECGACNVQVDGRLVASCLVPAATAAGSEVRTVEGLATDGEPSDVQRALAACGAVQCGFCIPGMAMTVHDLLEGNHSPTELEARQALCGNLCRCSGYRGVLDAVAEVVAGREASAAAAAEANEAPGADPAPEARIPHQAPPGAGSVQPHPHDGGMA
ncbi:2Fe-2S iron-sulfur cluster-binding protein [Streptomyces albipurpureus]|uniref:2Fe-2S iron-sulfur cluster-binding protein n=1 Tax=Streptomyces albipurpureus TaxID=2897419 RepID=A0ABT0UUN3_9ACTN|nr:2Fe-2S iron-sulfur cluster-binding protein [Streptomyces sp. CWNU-1]MCM2392277.1 2Fe-2S iron-sulfur cluster-binding protein [Streptomyces sp. CWNU-1]